MVRLSAYAAIVAGKTGGQLAVNANGGANYTIPIEVPPGTAGMQPKLALNYNSQKGNGLLGMGWSLSGLSTITRCARTQAQDGVRGSVQLNSHDRFCLDGKRLMAVSGTYGADNTEYRTEIETWTKVISNGDCGGGPCSFTAWTKKGIQMEWKGTRNWNPNFKARVSS